MKKASIENSYDFKIAKFKELEKTRRVMEICKTLNNYTNGTNVTYDKEVQCKALSILERMYLEE